MKYVLLLCLLPALIQAQTYSNIAWDIENRLEKVERISGSIFWDHFTGSKFQEDSLLELMGVTKIILDYWRNQVTPPISQIESYAAIDSAAANLQLYLGYEILVSFPYTSGSDLDSEQYKESAYKAQHHIDQYLYFLQNAIYLLRAGQ